MMKQSNAGVDTLSFYRLSFVALTLVVKIVTTSWLGETFVSLRSNAWAADLDHVHQVKATWPGVLN